MMGAVRWRILALRFFQCWCSASCPFVGENCWRSFPVFSPSHVLTWWWWHLYSWLCCFWWLITKSTSYLDYMLGFLSWFREHQMQWRRGTLHWFRWSFCVTVASAWIPVTVEDAKIKFDLAHYLIFQSCLASSMLVDFCHTSLSELQIHMSTLLKPEES